MADESTPETVDALVAAHAAKNAPELDGDPTKKIDPPPPPVDVVKDKDNPPTDDLKGLMTEFGVDSVEQLRERLKPKDDAIESPEQKKKREDLYHVEMQRFSVEEGLMKPEDFVQLNTLKAKDDRSLVFDNWLTSWKEENPDVQPEELERRSREDFDAEYHLNSQNEKTKARGEKKLADEAKSLRNPLETAYGTVKTRFDEEQALKADFPNYNKKLTGLIQDAIPGKIKLFEGKGNVEDETSEVVPVEAELTDDQRKDIYAKVLKSLNNGGTYQTYKKGDEKAMQDAVGKAVESVLWSDYRPIALQGVASTFHRKGFEKGQIGAKNPFPLNKDKSPAGGGKESADSEVLNQKAFKGNT